MRDFRIVLRLAWRNLWRHSRRTWLTVGAMVFCNVLLIFLISLQLGSYQMMIDNSLAAMGGGSTRPAPAASVGLRALAEAAGGSGVGVALSDKDRQIVETVAPRLREQGILFAGLDVIGDYLTEVNVTSPTCIRELDQLYDLNISAVLMDCIEQKLAV